MKTIISLFIGVVSLSFFSCQEKEEPATINLLGEWKIEGSSTEVLLNGQVSTIAEMGMEIYGLNEESALIQMEEYLQTQILGPLSLSNADVRFVADLVTVRLGEEQRSSSWQLLNDKRLLELSSLEENLQYLFNLNFRSNQHIDLFWEWQIQKLHDPINVDDLEIRLKLVR